MALRQLFELSTSSYNPSNITKLLPGGAGVQVAGTSPNPGISGPRLEEYETRALDVTATGSTPTPAPTGTLMVMNAITGTIGGSTWSKSNQAAQRLARGQYGIVNIPGQATDETASGGLGTGSDCYIVTDGPIMALVTTGPTTTTAISAGMWLGADGAGNLTYAGTNPSSGAVLATAMDSMATGISTPTLKNVFAGGF
jgi:hypothetical protein